MMQWKKKNQNSSEGNMQYICGNYMKEMIKSWGMADTKYYVVNVSRLPGTFQSSLTKSHPSLLDKVNLVSVHIILN